MAMKKTMQDARADDARWKVFAMVDQLSLEEQLALFHPLMLSLLMRIDDVAAIDPTWPYAARAFVGEYQAAEQDPRIIRFRRRS
jgi:hypothetical protein